MSEGSSGEPEREQDPWSQSADPAQLGAAAAQPEVVGYPPAGPDSWSTTWADPASPASQPAATGYAPAGPDSWSTTWADPASPARPTPPDQPGSSARTGQQLPPPTANGFGPAGVEPSTAPSGSLLPPSGQYPSPSDQYPPTSGQSGGQYGYQPSAGQQPQAAAQYPQPAGQYPQPAAQYPQPAEQYPQPAGQYGYQPTPGQYPGPAGQYGSQPWPGYPTGPRNNRVAIAALVCGIGQFVLGLLIVGNILLAIPAIICGAIGLKQTSQRGEGGRSMAIAGLVLGILGVVYFLVIVVVLIIIGSIHNTGSS